MDMWAASPCGKLMFRLAILILPRFKLDAMLVGIMLTAGFTSGSRLKLVVLLLLAACDVWMNDGSFLIASV